LPIVEQQLQPLQNCDFLKRLEMSLVRRKSAFGHVFDYNISNLQTYLSGHPECSRGNYCIPNLWERILYLGERNLSLYRSKFPCNSHKFPRRCSEWPDNYSKFTTLFLGSRL